MDPLLAWAILVIGFLLPVLHVALSPAGGPWRTPPGARCPLPPRLGWLVLVLTLGPLGWVLFMAARRRAASSGSRSSS